MRIPIIIPIKGSGFKKTGVWVRVRCWDDHDVSLSNVALQPIARYTPLKRPRVSISFSMFFSS